MNDTSQHILALFAAPQHGFVPSDPPVAIGEVIIFAVYPLLQAFMQMPIQPCRTYFPTVFIGCATSIPSSVSHLRSSVPSNSLGEVRRPIGEPCFSSSRRECRIA